MQALQRYKLASYYGETGYSKGEMMGDRTRMLIAATGCVVFVVALVLLFTVGSVEFTTAEHCHEL